jgi:hypothetical protein
MRTFDAYVDIIAKELEEDLLSYFCDLDAISKTRRKDACKAAVLILLASLKLIENVEMTGGDAKVYMSVKL